MDIVLGVSMAPTSVRMLLVEGENADGVTVEDNNFDISTDDDAATLSAADQVVSAILGTREGATQAGHALASTGVTWTDPVDAAALREALATRKIENVMLVSAFMAAAALAQMVGSTVGDAHTALLFIEPDTATLAVVDSADGSITDVHKELLSGADTVAALAEMVAGLDALETRPQSVFIVGTGVDIAALKPQLEAVTSLPVTAAEEPETALAWGAALASANAPLFASSTAALAYAQDPGTGAIDPYAVAPGYLAVPDVPFGTELGEEDLAYSAVKDEEAEAHTAALNEPAAVEHLDGGSERRPLLLAGTVLAIVIVAAFLSLEVALALGIRPSVALLPRPLQNLIVPTQQAPAPAAPPASATSPQANHVPAPAVVSPRANAPIPAPPRAAPAPAPIPAARPVPAAPPAPVAAPVPVAAPHVPVLIPLPIPALQPPPVRIPPWHAPAPTPVHFPVPQPPVSFPAQPPVSVPVRPHPVHQPYPQPPVHVPAPQEPIQVVAPQPPAHGSAPDLPVHMPAPMMPAPDAPAAPSFPSPEAPGMPAIQAPGASPDSPRVPDVGAPPMQGPSFNSPGDDTGAGHGFGGFGGSPGGPGGFGGGPGGFGGNSGGPGGFGGGPGGFGGDSGGFGGGHGFGGFGGFGGGGFGGGGFGGGGFGGGHGGGGGGHR